MKPPVAVPIMLPMLALVLAALRKAAARVAAPLAAMLLPVLLGLSGCFFDSSSDPAPVSISAQPASVTVVAGSPATFSVTAAGDGLAYQWQRSSNGGSAWADIAGATAASYTLASADASLNGAQFHVVVSGSVNAVTSSAATLAVTAAPTPASITTQPANATVFAGDNASFAVTAAGTSLTYQWQSSADGSTWTNIAGATATTLTLNAVALADSGKRLRVVVSNSLGSVASTGAVLNVNAVTGPPVVTAQPAAAAVTVQQAATFNVTATGNPAPTYQWQVSSNGGTSYGDIAGATSASYTTAPSGIGDNGQLYRVHLVNALGDVFSTAALLTVAAPTAPAITSSPTSSTVTAPATATFTAAASGAPTPTVQWQVSTDSGATFTNINGATATSYSTPATATTDSGKQFRAVFTNSVGSATSGAATLTVNSAPTLSGTAASGSAWAGAAVAVTDSSGAAACQESAVTTSAAGNYICTLRAGRTAPFFVVVNDPAGGAAPLVSATTSMPAAGVTAVLNATPLTTALLAQLASDGRPLTLVAGGVINAAAFQQLATNVLAQLGNVLSAIGAPAGYNPFSTPIQAATAGAAGNAADQVLDVVKTVSDPASGQLALTTWDNPTPVLLATATSAGAALPAPAAASSGLAQAAQIEAQAANSCFALPLAQRVTASDATVALAQGGPAVTAMAAACQAIAASANNGAGIDFKHRGYAFGQYFYSLLTSDTMTGAVFTVPEVMAVYPAASSASGKDEAVLNFKFLDANGNPGNIITLARNLPGTATTAHPTTWWLTGDQQTVDVNIRVLMRRVEQMNTASANVSHYQAGLQFVVNAKGPGSVLSNGATMNYARITGPGLPTSGLVFGAPVAAEVGQVQMDLLNQVGAITGTPTCFNCPNYWFNQTGGISGTAASTLVANPSGLTWAPTGVDTSRVVKGQTYRVDLFYGSSTTAGYSLNVALLSGLTSSNRAGLLAWNAAGSSVLAVLNPANTGLNGVLTSVTADWLQNPAAEQISSVNVIVSNGSFSTAQLVPRGATSIVITPSPSVPALTTTSSRGYLMHYRTRDNTDKNSYFTYN